jgi:hypothetical protein
MRHIEHVTRILDGSSKVDRHEDVLFPIQENEISEILPILFDLFVFLLQVLAKGLEILSFFNGLLSNVLLHHLCFSIESFAFPKKF